MGKKATLLLTATLFDIFAFIIAVLAILGWVDGYIESLDSWAISMVGLGLMPLLCLNLLVFIYKVYKRSWWAIIQLGVILLNINYISAMIQFDFRSKDELKSEDIKIATYNVHGTPTDAFNFDLKMVMKYFNSEGVDIICFQEFCDNEGARTDSIFSVYPYSVIHSQNKGMQLAVFSKYPLENSKFLSFENTANCAMSVDVDFKQSGFKILNVHFQTTNLNQSKTEIARVKNLGIEDPEGKQAFDIVMQRISDNASRRAEQVVAVRKVIDSTMQKKPMIVCGDFNDTPASYTYHAISKGLVDGFKTAGSGYGYTYKSLYKIFRIDYMFYTPNFTAIEYVSPNVVWSDHNPVILSLAI